MVCSNNEWGPLKEVILGTAIDMEWFDEIEATYPPGKVDPSIIKTTESELKIFQDILEGFGVNVLRPSRLAYSTRDTILIIGNKVIFTPLYYKTRQPEWDELKKLLPPDAEMIYAPMDDNSIMFDAANIIKANKDILYLVSCTGNIGGAQWLQKILGNEYKVHLIENAYGGSHIDSTVVLLQEGLVLLNGSRVTNHHLPEFFKMWDKIWVNDADIVDGNEYGACSKWMGLNMFSVDPNNVIIDAKQKRVRDMIEQYDINTHGITLTHSRYLLGGAHCVTLDTIRES